MEWNNLPAVTYFRVNPLAPAAGALPGEPARGRARVLSARRSDPRRRCSPPEPSTSRIPPPGIRSICSTPQPGERILDACAAPGGKAFLIAAALGSAENLVCTDSNEKRLPRLQQNLERLHAGNATIACHDWTQPAPAEWHGTFDGILLDVPCSNTGVIRRRVDVRWRLQAPDIDKIAITQRKILENALPCLKPGGRLVYSTCSIEREENLGQVEAFLADHPELELKAVREALPFRDQTDGAFAARIERGNP